MNIDCVILAAGSSSRIGQNKLLLDICGKTVLERCIDAFYNYSSRIIVVTGKYHVDIKQCLTRLPKIHIVYNKDYRHGMFGSVKAGVSLVESERFFLTPGDYPLLQNSTVRRMIDTPGCFVVPVYKGERGHPILLDKLFIPLIRSSVSPSLRDCLKKSAQATREVCVNDIGVVTDIDTTEEYRALFREIV